MSEAVVVPVPIRSIGLGGRITRAIPGILLLVTVGYAGKVTEQLLRDYGKAHHVALPNIEYVLWAILFGLVIANTVGVPRVFKPGIATYEVWLKAGIVLLGARFLLGDVLKRAGISLAGLAVDNTAEAAAAGALYSDAAGKIAVLTKSTRNAMIGFVVLGYAVYWAARGQAHQVSNKAAFVWQKFPKFVLGFLFISLLATVGAFQKEQIASIANLSRWAFLLTFAGVGLKTDFRELKKQGVRPFVVGALAELFITIVTLGLVLGAAALFHL